jgi:hypothetical protein
MLIGGKWIAAASGKTFETFNPATGELLAIVAEGDAEDINRAVAAARRAFEGPWSKVKRFERQALLLKLADLVERNFEELSQLDTLDMGAPISRTRGNKLRVLGMLRYYAGQATRLGRFAPWEKVRHARPCVGHPRLHNRKQDVDGPDKPGHDEITSTNGDLLPARNLHRPPDIAAQCREFFLHRAGGVAFDLAVACDQRLAERCQHRAAAVLAAGLPLDGGMAADPVDLVDQVPRPLVGHVHRAPGGRNRTAGMDVFQELDLARPDPALGVEIDPDAQARQRFGGGFLHRRRALSDRGLHCHRSVLRTR